MPGRASSVAGSTFNQPRSVCGDARCAPRLCVGAAARGNQQTVGRYSSSGLQADDDGRALVRWSGGLLFDADTWIADHQRDAIRRQVWTERGSCLRFLEPEECRSRLDYRDLGAEAREGLAQLDADGAAAEDRQRRRQLPRNGRLAVGPELDRVQPGDRWNRRRAAVGDHHGAARDELVASNLDRAQVRQCPSPRKSLAPVASSAAAGRLSSRLRAIHSTRLETFGKSTAHSTREAARRRARSASLNVSPERSKVFEGTQPQYGHSPPTSSRSTTASVSPLP